MHRISPEPSEVSYSFAFAHGLQRNSLYVIAYTSEYFHVGRCAVYLLYKSAMESSVERLPELLQGGLRVLLRRDQESGRVSL